MTWKMGSKFMHVPKWFAEILSQKFVWQVSLDIKQSIVLSSNKVFKKFKTTGYFRKSKFLASEEVQRVQTFVLFSNTSDFSTAWSWITTPKQKYEENGSLSKSGTWKLQKLYMKGATARFSAELRKKSILLVKSRTVFTFKDFTTILNPTGGEIRRTLAHVGLKTEVWCPAVLFLDKLFLDKIGFRRSSVR